MSECLKVNTGNQKEITGMAFVFLYIKRPWRPTENRKLQVTQPTVTVTQWSMWVRGWSSASTHKSNWKNRRGSHQFLHDSGVAKSKALFFFFQEKSQIYPRFLCGISDSRLLYYSTAGFTKSSIAPVCTGLFTEVLHITSAFLLPGTIALFGKA